MKMYFCLSVYTIEYGFVNMFKSKSLIDGLKTRICEKEYSTNLLHKNNIYGDIHSQKDFIYKLQNSRHCD